MRWRDQRQSTNVEDRRGMGGRTLAVGGGLGGLVVVILYLLLGGNLSDKGAPDLGLTTDSSGVPSAGRALTPEEKDAGAFVSVILADTEDVWNMMFQRDGKTYREPRLVLFTGT